MRDLSPLQRAVQRAWRPGSRWHIGGLAWQWSSVERDDPVVLHAYDAWGWLASPADLELHVTPGRPDLAAAILDWALDRAAPHTADQPPVDGPPVDGLTVDEPPVDGLAVDRPSVDQPAAVPPTGDRLAVTTMAQDTQLARVLAARRFRPAASGAFFQQCLLDLAEPLPPVQLPPGYRARALRPEETGARAALHRAAWRPARVGELMIPPRDLGDAESRVRNWRAVTATWPYRMDLDLVIEAPDGALAAFALGWMDEVNRVGELEPVGTDPRHARLGLGTAVSLACLHALRAAGATRALVSPRGDAAYPVPLALYSRLGFRPIDRTVTWHAPTGTG